MERSNTLKINSNYLNLVITRLAAQIFELKYLHSNLVILAVQPRGVFLASQIQSILKNKFDQEIEIETIDPSFFRDDIHYHKELILPNRTYIKSEIENNTILLIDDIIFTGRTVRASIEAILQIARPKAIKTLCFINRHFEREIPISVDYEGFKLSIDPGSILKIHHDENNKITVQLK